MDIRDWSMDRIMQLPDHCFGRRWLLGVGGVLSDANSVYDMAEASLPDRFVIWGVNGNLNGVGGDSIDVTLALGMKLPTSDAEFDQLELLFAGVTSRSSTQGSMYLVPSSDLLINTLRQSVVSGGRRLIGRLRRDGGAPAGGALNIVISSIPREIPDHLIISGTEQLDEIITLLRVGVKFPR